MLDIKTFEFEENQIRYVGDGEDHWWVAADICKALNIGNVSEAVSRLEPEEKDDIKLIDTIGREQKYLKVNESGLYSLVFGSRKEIARRFKKWVTQEVLPSIRKTGRYEVNPKTKVTESPENFLSCIEQTEALIQTLDSKHSGKVAQELKDAALFCLSKHLGRPQAVCWSAPRSFEQEEEAEPIVKPKHDRPLPPLDYLRDIFFVDEDLKLRWRRIPSGSKKAVVGGLVGSKPDRGSNSYVQLEGASFSVQRIIQYCLSGVDPGYRQYSLLTRKHQANNKSGFVGVSAVGKRWTATIKRDGKSNHLGTFDTFEEAVYARQQAELEVYGEARSLDSKV